MLHLGHVQHFQAGFRLSSLPLGTCRLSRAATLGVLGQCVAPPWGQLFCGYVKCNDLWNKGYRSRRHLGAVRTWIRLCVHELLRAQPGPALFSAYFVHLWLFPSSGLEAGRAGRVSGRAGRRALP